MPRERRCDFCESEIEPGTGTMFVRTNGATIHFCSSKCENNAALGRESRDLEWAGQEDEAEAATEEADETEEAEEERLEATEEETRTETVDETDDETVDETDDESDDEAEEAEA
jgi:large subunit ribosomal protein L24e